jgi:hypothetical protein
MDGLGRTSIAWDKMAPGEVFGATRVMFKIRAKLRESAFLIGIEVWTRGVRNTPMSSSIRFMGR